MRTSRLGGGLLFPKKSPHRSNFIVSNLEYGENDLALSFCTLRYSVAFNFTSRGRLIDQEKQEPINL